MCHNRFLNVGKYMSLLLPEDTTKETKNMLDLMKIPGCILTFAHVMFLRISSSSRMTEFSNWLHSQVTNNFRRNSSI